MHRKEILAELHSYKKSQLFFPEEASNFDLIYNFICNEPEFYNHEQLGGHVTTSSFLLTYTLDAVLLMHHKKLDRWHLIGEHTDGADNFLELALKQAREESGIVGITPVSTAIFDLDARVAVARKNEAEHWHFDIRFLLKAPRNARYITNSTPNVLKWIKLEDVHKYSDEQSILRMADKVKLLQFS